MRQIYISSTQRHRIRCGEGRTGLLLLQDLLTINLKGFQVSLLHICKAKLHLRRGVGSRCIDCGLLALKERRGRGFEKHGIGTGFRDKRLALGVDRPKNRSKIGHCIGSVVDATLEFKDSKNNFETRPSGFQTS